MMRFFLCLLHVCFGFSLVAGDAAKVEAEWRYQDTFALNVTNGSVTTLFSEDFLKQVHNPMAYYFGYGCVNAKDAVQAAIDKRKYSSCCCM